MNLPLTPALYPSDGERVSKGRVRGIRVRSWSQGAIRDSWELPMNLLMNSGRSMNPKSLISFMFRPEFMWKCSDRFMVSMRDACIIETRHEPPPHPAPLPIRWGEGVRKTGEGNSGAFRVPRRARFGIGGSPGGHAWATSKLRPLPAPVITWLEDVGPPPLAAGLRRRSEFLSQRSKRKNGTSDSRKKRGPPRVCNGE